MRKRKLIKTTATTIVTLAALSAVAITAVTTININDSSNENEDIKTQVESDIEDDVAPATASEEADTSSDKTGLEAEIVSSPANTVATKTDAGEDEQGQDKTEAVDESTLSSGKILPVFESVVSGGKADKIQDSNTDDNANTTHTKVGLSALTTEADYATVDGSYFDDALFIGNSRTVGLLLWSGVSGIDLAYTGLNVTTAYTLPAKNYKGNKVPVMEAMKHKRFSKAYIMFGVNEVGWMSSDTFAESYRKIIQDIKKKNPDAIIYVQSVLPVTEKFEKERGDITNKKIAKFNKALRKLADEENVIYLNVAECIIDERGYLPQNSSPDGYHMDQPNCIKWLDYLKTHAIAN